RLTGVSTRLHLLRKALCVKVDAVGLLILNLGLCVARRRALVRLGHITRAMQPDTRCCRQGAEERTYHAADLASLLGALEYPPLRIVGHNAIRHQGPADLLQDLLRGFLRTTLHAFCNHALDAAAGDAI